MSSDDVIKWLVGLVGAVVAGWLAALSWIFNRQIKRLDDLDDELVKLYASKANKESTDQRFDRLIAQLEAHIAEDRSTHMMIAQKIDTTNERLANTNENLAGLRGELRQRWIGKGGES